jgi:hypothetical protein
MQPNKVYLLICVVGCYFYFHQFKSQCMHKVRSQFSEKAMDATKGGDPSSSNLDGFLRPVRGFSKVLVIYDQMGTLTRRLAAKGHGRMDMVDVDALSQTTFR